MRVAAFVGGLVIALAMVGCRGGATGQPQPAIDTRAGEPWHCVPDAKRTSWICERGDDFPAVPEAVFDTPVVAPSAEPPSVAPVVTLLPQRTADETSSHASPSAERSQRDVEVDLFAVPGNHYVVQLTAMSERRELEALIDTLDVDGLFSARVESDAKVFYVLLYGVYAERTDAEAAARERPPSLLVYEPWIRSVGSLQDAMRRADAQPDEVPGGT